MASENPVNTALMKNMPAWKRNIKRVLSSWQLYVLILPVYCIFCFSISHVRNSNCFQSFRPTKGIWGSEWVGLKHFIRFFKFPNFGNIS